MIREIFHGSSRIINETIWGAGSGANDFGRGFYCTENLELAKEWACKEAQDGFANEYQIDESGLRICNLNSGEFTILNWLAVLTRYRSYWQRKSIAEEAKEYLQSNYYVDLSEYDIVIGYRADDSYFSFAQDFIMGTISLQKLSEAMQLGKLGEQYVLKSQKAFERIHFVRAESADSSEYYLKKTERDREARRKYRDEKQKNSLKDDIYIVDILRGDVKLDGFRI